MSFVLPLVVLKNIVVIPKTIVPVIIGRDFSIDALELALLTKDKKVIVTCQKEDNDQAITYDNINDIGVVATVLQSIKSGKASYKVLLEGLEKVNIVKLLPSTDKEKAFYALYDIIETEKINDVVQLKSITRALDEIYSKYKKNNEKSLIDIKLLEIAEDQDLLDSTIDVLVANMPLKNNERYRYLAINSLFDKISFVIKFFQAEIDIIETEERIKSSIQSQIEASQREYYLNEQLKAIQKELKRDSNDSILESCRDRFLSEKFPEKISTLIDKEIEKLDSMQQTSPEATIIRNYVEWLLALPWSNRSEDTISLNNAQKILDANHFGLSKVKERILELIAAKKYSQGKIKSTILCLVGPPGVGKTSLGKSIAQSLNREFISISLGGVRDEAEIRGHRRTYIGAMPGKIIRSMKKAKTINPVILLDEIDKMAHDIHGDPSAALLEVLDYSQNNTFMDNYLDIEYDLSNVIFITTANTAETIPSPLLDRMEVINIPGYTHNEKMSIAKLFLIPKQLEEHTVSQELLNFNDDALGSLIAEYTREAGVRQLERYISRIIRKAIMHFLNDAEQKEIMAKKESKKKNKEEAKKGSYIIDKNRLTEFLKYPLYKLYLEGPEQKKPGIATGLAWTEMGGDLLDIEIAIVPGKGNITITGQLGEIMQESAQAAFTYVKMHMKEFNISKQKFSQYDVHIHVPEGATPKDGPSAGITMCAALLSAFTNNPVKRGLAMTGEITLQGRVLPVGGLKEKILAAHLNGYKELCLPLKNKDVCDEAREEIGSELDSLIFHYVDTMDEVISFAFEKNIVIPSIVDIVREKRAIKKEKLKIAKNKKLIKINELKQARKK